MNDTILTFVFRCEKRMSGCVQLQNFVFRSKTTNGRMGTRTAAQISRMIYSIEILIVNREPSNQENNFCGIYRC